MERECLRCGKIMIKGRISDSPASAKLRMDGKFSPLFFMGEHEKVSLFNEFGTFVRASICPQCGCIELVGENFI